MSSQDAYKKLIDEQDGTFTLRKNEKGELRFSVRRTMTAPDAVHGSNPVGHICVIKCENGQWKTGNTLYDTFNDMLGAYQTLNSSYQFKHRYCPGKPKNVANEESGGSASRQSRNSGNYNVYDDDEDDCDDD